MKAQDEDIRFTDLLSHHADFDWHSVIEALRERHVAALTLEPKSGDQQAVDTELVTIALLRLAAVQHSPSIEAVLELEHTAGCLYNLSLHEGNNLLQEAALEALQLAVEQAEISYGADHRRTIGIQAKLALWQENETTMEPGDGVLQSLVDSVTVPDLLEQLRKLEYSLTQPPKAWSDSRYTASLAVLSLSLAQIAYGHKHAGVFWMLWQLGREKARLDGSY